MSDNERKSDADLMAQAKELINAKEFYDAQKLLKAVQKHDAYWNFLSGKLYFGMKWTSEARKFFKLAVEADPENVEYKNALDELENTAASEEERITKGEFHMSKSTCNYKACFECLGAKL